MVAHLPQITDEATRTRVETLEQELAALKAHVETFAPMPEPAPEPPAPEPPQLYIQAADGSFVPAPAPQG